ncbi:MAG: DNA polymerase I [Bdellovibrionota bacterium]
MEPLYLVDGSGYIFRAYYAIAPLSNRAGLPTNALFGFVRMLTKLIRDNEAKYIAVTFDTGQPTFRHAMYTEYKANRKECPEDLSPQMPYFRKIVEALGIRSLEKPGFEADDIIGTITTKFAEKGHDVVIVSGDKDLCQLVDNRVRVFDAMRDTMFTPDLVKAKFGVRPDQICDYLALIGDSSDNVPGLKGVGPKTAEKLIEHFGSIDKLLEQPRAIEEIPGMRGAKSVREKVEAGSESLRLSLQLVCLDRNVEPFNRIENVEEFAFDQVRTDLLEPLFEELEFTNMLSSLEFAGAGGARRAAATLSKEKDYEILTAETLPQFAAELARQPYFAFDTETNSLDVLNCALLGISFSWKRHQAFYLPLAGDGSRGHCVDRTLVWELLNPIFSNPEIRKVGLNLKFDIGVLEEYGFRVRGVTFDAMLASHILHPDRRQNGLKTLAQVHLQETMVTYDELVSDIENIELVPLESLSKYACHDAEASWGLYEKLDALLGEPGQAVPSQRAAFERVEMPLVEVLSQMERDGIKVDVPFLEVLGTEFSGELSQLETQICALAGREFNLNSPKQLGAVLFDELKLPTSGVKKTQSGYSTDASVLSMLSKDFEIAAKLLEYRELHKLNSTYVEALKRLVHPKTGRIHTSFNQAIAATGRLSSTDPNLQNIPIRNPRGRKLRRAFIAEPGHSLIAVDYSQIELRVLAHLSGDGNLKQAFIDGVDIHSRTADEIFGAAIASPEERKELRRVAKTINFGIVYGMGAFRLSRDLGVTRKQAQQYIDEYFARYPKVLQYFESLRGSIEKSGYVETLFGRRRFASELDTTGRDGGYAERSLLNAPIQGSAAEIIKVAMTKLHSGLVQFERRAKMLLQVHDELVFEVEDKILSEVRDLVVSTMESAVPLDVPIRVDVRSGTTWGEDV